MMWTGKLHVNSTPVEVIWHFANFLFMFVNTLIAAWFGGTLKQHKTPQVVVVFMTEPVSMHEHELPNHLCQFR